MGFKRKRTVYKLDFSGTQYDGLEVRLTGLTTGEYLDLVSLSAPGDTDGRETDQTLRLFAAHLISWNLEDEKGEPIPVTFDGIKTNDLVMNMFIIEAWTDALVDVSESTEKKSLAGDPSLVASIPMEPLSTSQPS